MHDAFPWLGFRSAPVTTVHPVPSGWIIPAVRRLADLPETHARVVVSETQLRTPQVVDQLRADMLAQRRQVGSAVGLDLTHAADPRDAGRSLLEAGIAFSGVRSGRRVLAELLDEPAALAGLAGGDFAGPAVSLPTWAQRLRLAQDRAFRREEKSRACRQSLWSIVAEHFGTSSDPAISVGAYRRACLTLPPAERQRLFEPAVPPESRLFFRVLDDLIVGDRLGRPRATGLVVPLLERPSLERPAYLQYMGPVRQGPIVVSLPGPPPTDRRDEPIVPALPSGWPHPDELATTAQIRVGGVVAGHGESIGQVVAQHIAEGSGSRPITVVADPAWDTEAQAAAAVLARGHTVDLVVPGRSPHRVNMMTAKPRRAPEHVVAARTPSTRKTLLDM